MTQPPVADRPKSMTDYGVPDELDGLLPWAWASERLVGYRNYWVTTVSPDSAPHSMPVWGVWLEPRGAFYFSCSASAYKARNLSSNPRVVIGGDDTVEVVSLEGRAEALSDDDEIDEVIDAWITKYGGEIDDEAVAEMREFMRQNAVWAVRPTKAFGVIERPEDFGPRATRWRWLDS